MFLPSGQSCKQAHEASNENRRASYKVAIRSQRCVVAVRQSNVMLVIVLYDQVNLGCPRSLEGEKITGGVVAELEEAQEMLSTSRLTISD